MVFFMFIALFTVFLIKLEELTLYDTLPFFFLSSMFDFFLKMQLRANKK